MFGNEFCSTNKCKLADGGGQAISCVFFALVCANHVKSMANAMPPRYSYGDDDDDENSLWYDDEEDKYRPVTLYESDNEDDDEASWESYYESDEDDDDDDEEEDADSENNDDEEGVYVLASDDESSDQDNPGNLGVGYEHSPSSDEPIFDPSTMSNDTDSHQYHNQQQQYPYDQDVSGYGRQPRVGDDGGPTIT